MKIGVDTRFRRTSVLPSNSLLRILQSSKTS